MGWGLLYKYLGPESMKYSFDQIILEYGKDEKDSIENLE
jgi:hypothetical protein